MHDQQTDVVVTCPLAEAISASRLMRPRKLYQLIYHVHRKGMKWLIHRVLVTIHIVRERSAVGGRGQTHRPAIHLRPGDWAEVRTEQEILATLDSNGRHRGLAFIPEMKAYCGKRFRVHRRLERMYFEESHRLRKISDTVLLEGVYCDGQALGCDRSCFLFWREAWLNRVPYGPVD